MDGYERRRESEKKLLPLFLCSHRCHRSHRFLRVVVVAFFLWALSLSRSLLFPFSCAVSSSQWGSGASFPYCFILWCFLVLRDIVLSSSSDLLDLCLPFPVALFFYCHCHGWPYSCARPNTPCPLVLILTQWRRLPLPARGCRLGLCQRSCIAPIEMPHEHGSPLLFLSLCSFSP
jgi:hypothetical protein